MSLDARIRKLEKQLLRQEKKPKRTIVRLRVIPDDDPDPPSEEEQIAAQSYSNCKS